MTDFFKTGDLLLCDYRGFSFLGGFSYLIEYFTKSNYSHMAMIIKDPSFIHPSLKGLFVWESSWEGKPDPQDNRIKLGVQMTTLDNFLKNYHGKSKVYYRKLNCFTSAFSDEKLKEIHDVVYEKPYDLVPRDWVDAYFNVDSKPQKTDRFWCSALVGYIYTKLGLLPKETDWSILRPSDFSDTSSLQFENCSLEKEKNIK